MLGAWCETKQLLLQCVSIVQVLALVVFLPVGKLHVRNLAWRALNLASAPLLYGFSLYSERIHAKIAPTSLSI